MLAQLEVVDAVTDAWVTRFVAGCHHAVAARGRFTVAISGGSTPLAGYRRLAERHDLPWERVWLTWGDERHVPRDHPDRNERAAREAWLDHVPIPAEHVLAWPATDDPERDADAHAQALALALGPDLDLDLALLGLGADAHTASLFPGTGAVYATGTTAVVRPFADGPARLTLTPSALSAAREAWLLVQGADKQGALRATLAAGLLDARPDAGENLDRWPALAIRPRERLLVIADRAAAGTAVGAPTGAPPDAS